MNLQIDNGHLALLISWITTSLFGLAYHLNALAKSEAHIEKLLDRLMSRSVTEYKRVQDPKKLLPGNRQPLSDREMALMEERNKTAQEDGVNAMNEEIEQKLAEMREATGKAGVL